jgi:hypothetical protein
VDAIAAIRAAQERILVDEDGDEVELVLAPPASPGEVARLEEQLGFPLPGELRDVLALTRGIEGPLDQIDFLGDTGEMWGMPSALEIAEDGLGNFWVLDLTPEDADTVPVFYVCHDPPVVVFQSESLGTFLHEAFRTLTPPHESLVGEVHERHSFDIWRSDPHAMTPEQAVAAGGELADFARTLGHDEYRLYDLRDPVPGAGFVWSHPDEVLRNGHRRIFAVERRAKKRVLRRLFGRH